MRCFSRSNVFAEQGGFTLLEMIAAVAVLGAVVLGTSNLINQTVEDTKSSVTALYMKTVSNAANEYIQDNFAAVYSNVIASPNPIVIPLTTLRSSNHLPAGFSLTNPYGQSACVIVKSPAANNLLAMLATEDGADIDDISLAQIAGGIGSSGGAIYDQDINTIRGTMGGWSFNKSEFAGTTTKCDGVTSGGVNLSSGRLAVALWIAEGNSVNATLYRNDVPNNPSLNTMETPIIMGAGAQRNEGDVCATVGMLGRSSTGVVLSCDGSVWKRQASAYWSDPVLNFAALPATGDSVGSVRMTLDNNRAFMFTGAVWSPLSVDQNGDMTVPNTLNAANSRFSAYDVPSEGGVVRLTGNNGQRIYLQNENGRFRLINDPWTAELLAVNQNGDLKARGEVRSPRLVTDNGKVDLSELSGNGRVTIVGDNGQRMIVENYSGDLRVRDNSDTKDLFRLKQNGDAHIDGGANVVGTVTSQGDMIANGNISAGQTLSGGYAQLTVTSTVASSCAPEGLISRDTSGQLLVCEASVWTYAAKQFSGETCGLMNSSGSGSYCQGYDPRIDCPGGYHQMSIGLGADAISYCGKA